MDLKGTREDRVLIYVARIEVLGCYGGKETEEDEEEVETDVNTEYDDEFEDVGGALTESESSDEDIRPDPLSPLRVRPTTNFTPLNSSPSAATSNRAVFRSPARDVSPSPINSFRSPIRKRSPVPVRTGSFRPDFKFPPGELSSRTVNMYHAAPTRADTKTPERDYSASPIDLDDEFEAVPMTPAQAAQYADLASPLRETVVKNLAMLPASTPPQFRVLKRSA